MPKGKTRSSHTGCVFCGVTFALLPIKYYTHFSNQAKRLLRPWTSVDSEENGPPSTSGYRACRGAQGEQPQCDALSAAEGLGEGLGA